MAFYTAKSGRTIAYLAYFVHFLVSLTLGGNFILDTRRAPAH